MVSVTATQLNGVNDTYQIPGSRAAQNIATMVQQRSDTPSVQVSERDVLSPRIYDSLTRIQELVENGVNASGIIAQNINVNMANPEYYRGTTQNADASQYASYEGVPNGNFQVYTPPELSDEQLQDLVRSSARTGNLFGGDEALFKALQNDTAKIYNQADSENLMGKPVDWKQDSIGGTMWDRSMIDQKAVQQIQQDGKQIFAGAIGSIRFAVVY